MTRTTSFADLTTAGKTGYDPLSKLLHVGNQGGFRRVGLPARYVVLYSSQADPD